MSQWPDFHALISLATYYVESRTMQRQRGGNPGSYCWSPDKRQGSRQKAGITGVPGKVLRSFWILDLFWRQRRLLAKQREKKEEPRAMLATEWWVSLQRVRSPMYPTAADSIPSVPSHHLPPGHVCLSELSVRKPTFRVIQMTSSVARCTVSLWT